jgi:pimeloyl-ACP methyl ester carboxylesterase
MSRQSISRRAAVSQMAIAPLTGVLGPPVLLAPSRKKVFVLVHGAWHGGWCWKKVRPRLEKEGYTVHTPTLTGLGERAHLLTADVGLDTHTQDIVAMLEFEDLRDVILVGHSYGGMVITSVAGRVGQRLSQLVYLDAFLPEEGKSLSSYTPRPPESALPAGTAPPRDFRVPPRSTVEEFGVRDPADIAWARARLTPQSGKTFGQPLHLDAAIPDSVRKAYIQCTDDSPWFVEAAARAERSGYTSRKLFGGGHDAMISEPTRLAAMLLDLAR